MTQLTARVPISGDFYGDVSRSLTLITEAMARQGYAVSGRAIQTSTSWFTGAPVYGQAEFHIRQASGQPFEQSRALNLLKLEAYAAGVDIGASFNWGVQALTFVAQAPGAVLTEKGREQTREALKTFAGKATDTLFTNPVCAAIEGATGFKCTTVVAVAVAVGLGGFLAIYARPVFQAIDLTTQGARRLVRGAKRVQRAR